MSRSIYIQLLAVALATPFLVPEISAQERPAPPAMPAAAQQAGLCGITQQEVASIVAHYELEPDMAGVADALATPFDCSAYGNLCGVLDVPDAHAYVCGVWSNLQQHEAESLVVQEANDHLVQAAETCSGDMAVCEQNCDSIPPGGGAVLSCSGVRMNNKCFSIASCELGFNLGNLPTFEFLLP